MSDTKTSIFDREITHAERKANSAARNLRHALLLERAAKKLALSEFDMDKVEEADLWLVKYCREAVEHADEQARDVMECFSELLRERCLARGLPEDEIARIEQEIEAAVDQQIA